ncbi:MAG TPA: ribosome small subunit-dependent GTPase A [Candidatus Deferrimicrobium sp.]|nr:ribosome small subunit-dependent GTPase A [Candidatus Deferrimicrobium sp.]
MDKNEQGTVVAAKGQCFVVQAADGSRLLCEIRKKIKFQTKGVTLVAVGDDVVFSRSDHDRGAIEEVLQRSTMFRRPVVGRRDYTQVLAANLDRLACVVSVKSPPLKAGLIDRFIIAARLGQMEPIIVFTKIDLGYPDRFNEVMEAYRAATDGLFTVSAFRGDNLDQLRAYLRPHRTLVAGHSGVGKSTLLNALIPGLDLTTREISIYGKRGRHVTSSIELFELPGGGLVADAPGLKVMGLSNMTRVELPHYYAEFQKYEQSCRFQPCSHSHEPDCAVKSAVQRGEISRIRYDNYISIADSL